MPILQSLNHSFLFYFRSTFWSASQSLQTYSFWEFSITASCQEFLILNMSLYDSISIFVLNDLFLNVSLFPIRLQSIQKLCICIKPYLHYLSSSLNLPCFPAFELYRAFNRHLFITLENSALNFAMYQPFVVKMWLHLLSVEFFHYKISKKNTQIHIVC